MIVAALGGISIGCRSSEPAREQLDRSKIEPGLTAGDGRLKVFGEAAVAVEPGKGSLDHPAAWQEVETGAIGPLDDLDPPPAMSSQRRCQLVAGIAAIGKDMAQTWRNQGNGWRIEASRLGAPSRSWMSAAWICAATRCPAVSVMMWRLRPLIFLPAS